MSRTASVTKPSSVPRQVTIAGSQMRLGSSRPPRPMGKGWNSVEPARSLEMLLVVVLAVGTGLSALVVPPAHLALDAEVGQAPLQLDEASPVGRRLVAEGVEHLLQPRHAARELADHVDRQPLVAGRGPRERGLVAQPAQEVDESRAQAVGGFDELALEERVVDEREAVLDLLVGEVLGQALPVLRRKAQAFGALLRRLRDRTAQIHDRSHVRTPSPGAAPSPEPPAAGSAGPPPPRPAGCRRRNPSCTPRSRAS